MPDFSRFGADLADHTDKPPFDELRRRGRRRRRARVAFVAGAAAISVIAVIATAAGLDDTPRTDPAIAPPTSPTGAVSSVPTPARDQGELRRLVADRRTELVGFSAGLDGSELAQWETRAGGTILAIRAPGADSARLSQPEARLSRFYDPVPGGWLAYDTSDSAEPLLVDPDGVVVGLRTAPRSSVRPGDLAAVGSLSFFRPGSGTMHHYTLNQQLFSPYITPTGTVLGVRDAPYGAESADVVRIDGQGSTTTSLLTGEYVSIATIRGNGDHAAAVVTQDPAPGSDGGADPVVAVAVTDDEGASWRTVAGPDSVGEINPLVVTASGSVFLTLLVGFRDQDVFRLRPGDRELQEVEPPRANLTTQGDVLYAWDSEGIDRSTDDGATWTAVTPPGR